MKLCLQVDYIAGDYYPSGNVRKKIEESYFCLDLRDVIALSCVNQMHDEDKFVYFRESKRDPKMYVMQLEFAMRSGSFIYLPVGFFRRTENSPFSFNFFLSVRRSWEELQVPKTEGESSLYRDKEWDMVNIKASHPDCVQISRNFASYIYNIYAGV